METKELYQKVLEKLLLNEIHSLHKAMLEECCENALNNEQKVTDLETLIFAVQTAFVSCNKILKETLKNAVENFGADQVNLNYRGQSFSIPKDSNFLN